MQITTSNNVIKKVYLLNAVGQIIINRETSLENLELDCASIPPGIYEMQILQGKAIRSTRIIKF
ncbi:MAG: T9SS type A sorting domain-containing protein [Saprospiraceae bacterium]|nr:T9SS type A sorting domain-containing protein [Saprospiraceae bacterium]